jgi:hypothetical protein
METVDYVAVASRLLIDVFAVGVVLGVLVIRRHGGYELISALAVFNIGLFAVVQAVTTTEFGLGAGFGLFAVLSIIRLRSRLFGDVHLAYVFSILAIALVTGVPGLSLPLSAALAGVVMITTVAIDGERLSRSTDSCTVTLDTVVSDREALMNQVEERLGLEVVDIDIRDVDLVRETMAVRVRHRPSPRRSVPSRDVDRNGQSGPR